MSNEQAMNSIELDGVAMGDMPNLEDFRVPEVNNSFTHIGEAIQRADKKGKEIYGEENWDHMNAEIFHA